MVDSIQNKLEAFIGDIEDLRIDGDYNQNEIWGNQLRQFLQTTNITEADFKDFERLMNDMRLASSSKPYAAMKMFLKLISRKDLEFKKEQETADNKFTINPDFLKSRSKVRTKLKPVLDIPEITPTKSKTERILRSLSSTEPKLTPRSNKIFIVHGSDGESKLELAEVIREMGLEPIILHQQANEGKTVIEKFENYAGEVNFAFILFTPDDVGGKDKHNLKPRARQNVILEFGYFLGKLERRKVCCLYKQGVEVPSDMDGLVYIEFNKTPRDSYLDIKKELQAAGYNPK